MAAPQSLAQPLRQLRIHYRKVRRMASRAETVVQSEYGILARQSGLG
jgi:hypothetical protein